MVSLCGNSVPVWSLCVTQPRTRVWASVGCSQVIDQSTQTNPHLSPSLPPSASNPLLIFPSPDSFPSCWCAPPFSSPNRGVPWCLGDPPPRLPLLLFLRSLPCAFYQFAKMDTVRTTIVGDNMPLRLGGAERPHVLEWIKARLSQDEGVWGKVKVIVE